jgi:signal transduction histidine kinase
VHDELAHARLAPTPEEVMSLTLELVAHDLRSPLSSSRQAVGQLLAASANGDHRLLTVLAEALDTIGGMVDDLLGLEASPDATGTSRIDVDELMRTCVAACSCPERIDVLTVPARVEGNLALLKASIGNVIENALRHGGTEVLLRAGPVDSGTLVMVDDDGPGIPEELRELVFRPLVRLDPDGDQGAGLGLALVRRTVEFHGGSAWIEEAPSGGARFCIWLP